MNTNDKIKNIPSLTLSSNRKAVWFISLIAILISILGFIFSSLDPSIKLPLRPGLDFTGGTQIKLERDCNDFNCTSIDTAEIVNKVKTLEFKSDNKLPYLTPSKIQIKFLDGYKSLVLRLPFLSASQGQSVIEAVTPIAGPFESGGLSVETIGPSLGAQLLKSSLVSLIVAFTGIAIYISFRFDRRFASLALLALTHDLVIVCGVFSWLGIFYGIEIDSHFAVSLLTIAGYSVNDTVVVFDRIRELSKSNEYSYKEKIDIAVSATLTRTLYTSGSTLLPLIALIMFGGPSLYWFAISLTTGVIVGSWSSIALAPSLLSVMGRKQDKQSNKY